jgi:excinuclease ABC subunit C
MLLADKLRVLPDKPGVYLMKDSTGQIIYVGKAVSLKNRVRSYFQKSANHSPKVKAMVDQVEDFDYIITANEIEALILECNLIKEKSPKYNVRLKDDKDYPYIRIKDEPFPRVEMIRRPGPKDKVYGPYTDVSAVRGTLVFLRKIFPLRTCSLDLSPNQELNYRPCLLYHIGRCGAPCNGKQGEEEYRKVMEEVSLFLEGRHEQLLPRLTEEMEKSAGSQEYEKAARLRDQIKALMSMMARQRVVSNSREEQDVLGLAQEGTAACVVVLLVREGKMIGDRHFFLTIPIDEELPETVESFLKQYYSQATSIPKQVVLPAEIKDSEVLQNWLNQRRGGNVRMYFPKKGQKKELLKLAQDNARVCLENYLHEDERRIQANKAGLLQLQEILGLASLPNRIEAYDISHLQGDQMVASMAVLQEGIPDTSLYRRFKIKQVKGVDDFASMKEVIFRRFNRGLRQREELKEEEYADFSVFPDLIVIDGGKGQLNAAKEVLKELNLDDLAIIGLAKREEEIFLEDKSDPIVLDSSTPALHLLQRVRDEAHRFAVSYHHQLRGKQTGKSALDTVPGVGPARKKALLRHFGSVNKIKDASLEELQKVPGISEQLAGVIHQYLT